MVRYLARRVLHLIVMMVVVSILTFLIFMKLPAADPAQRAVGRPQTDVQVKQARHVFGLDRPIWVQYWRFAQGLVPWPGLFLNEDVYFDWRNNVPVSEEISRALPWTLMLALGTAVVWLFVGIPMGIVSALRRGKLTDKAVMIVAILGISAPDFWLAYLVLYIFWFKLGIAPSSGIAIGEGVWQAAFAGKFLMPWIVLASTFAGWYARMVRGSLLETLGEDYIRTARSKGMSEKRVVLKHAMRGALTPVVTMFGPDLAGLLGGAFIVETVFNLPGIGQLAIHGVFQDNFPVVMAVTMFGALLIGVANLIVDVTYAALDPRVRYA